MSGFRCNINEKLHSLLFRGFSLLEMLASLLLISRATPLYVFGRFSFIGQLSFSTRTCVNNGLQNPAKCIFFSDLQSFEELKNKGPLFALFAELCRSCCISQ